MLDEDHNKVGNSMKFKYRKKLFDIEAVSQDDHMYKIIVRSGTFYEIDLLNYIYEVKPFFPTVKGKNIAIDVGANIGNHSIFICSFIVDHLIAFEPNPDVLPKLCRNLAKNNCNYTLYECAVGEKESRGAIYIPENMVDNIGTARINLQSSDGNIEISTLDSVFSSWRENEKDPIALSLIKIDVEGMEPQVLKGAKNTIQKYKPHIFVEAATKDELQRIREVLHSFGYRRLPGNWAITPVYHFAHEPSFALLAFCYYKLLRRKVRIIMHRLTMRFTGR